VVEALRSAGRLLRRRGVVIVVVDRVCPLPRRELVALAGRHEVVVVRVTDPLLQKASNDTRLPVIDPEAGRRGVLRRAPRPRAEPTPPGIDVLELTTDIDYLVEVRAMLEARERRRVH
jgi:hypothetical protein